MATAAVTAAIVPALTPPAAAAPEVDAPPDAPPACAVWIGAALDACATACVALLELPKTASPRCTDCAIAAPMPKAHATAMEILLMRIMVRPLAWKCRVVINDLPRLPHVNR
jgi:hypothetical protein